MGCKPTKNVRKPSVFLYLELLDPSRRVLAPMFPTGFLVGDVFRTVLVAFWYLFSSPGILKIAIPFDNVVAFNDFCFVGREPTRVPSGTFSWHLFGSLLEPFDLILVPSGCLWTPLRSLWEVLGLMFFQLLELLELSRSVLAPFVPQGSFSEDILVSFWCHFATIQAPLACPK